MNPTPRVSFSRLSVITPWLLAAAFLLFTFAPHAAGQLVDPSERKLRYKMPCTFMYTDGAPYEKKVNDVQCDYMMSNYKSSTLDELEEGFNGMTFMQQEGLIQHAAKESAQKYREYEQKQKTLLERTDPKKVSQALSPEQRIKDFLDLKQQVMKESAKNGHTFCYHRFQERWKNYGDKEIGARVKELDKLIADSESKLGEKEKARVSKMKEKWETETYGAPLSTLKKAGGGSREAMAAKYGEDAFKQAGKFVGEGAGTGKIAKETPGGKLTDKTGASEGTGATKIDGRGQLTGGSMVTPRSKYENSKDALVPVPEPPKNSDIQTSLFALKAPPESLEAKKGWLSTKYQPKPSSQEDINLLNKDFKEMSSLPTGKKIIEGSGGKNKDGIVNLAPEMVPGDKGVLSVKIGGSEISADSRFQDFKGYNDKPRPVPMYYADKNIPGQAGGTYYDAKNNKTYIVLDPSLRNADAGVRYAVESEELEHVLQKQGQKNAGNQPLVSSTELEKSARLKALQVYDEYYRAHPEKDPPQNTQVEQELYRQRNLMVSDRKALMKDLDKQYSENPDTDNTKSVADMRKEIDAKYKNSKSLLAPYNEMKASEKIEPTEKYYDATLKENEEWCKSHYSYNCKYW